MIHSAGTPVDRRDRLEASATLDVHPGLESEHVRRRLSGACTPMPERDVTRLLRLRLRMAVLVVFFGFALHLFERLDSHGFEVRRHQMRVALADVQIAVLVCISALLWSGRPLSLAALRIIELTVFGTLAVFIGWLQIEAYRDGAMLEAVESRHRLMVLRLVGGSAALGWSLLIVLYGVFIPNTWRRCAAVVACLAAIPLALLVAESQLDPSTGPRLLLVFPEAATLIAISAAIAVFGSYDIGDLQQKARQARRIGQYRLLRLLGRGGMGAVYLAEHAWLRRPCALKLISAEQAGDAGTVIRFEREVQAAALLSHPNTVRVFDYGRAEDGGFYYVMEYLPGMDLQKMVDLYGPLPAPRALHLLRQVCGALLEAHGIGLLHRDVKPANIMSCELGGVFDVAKLLDFGLVRSAEQAGGAVRLTSEGGLTGSPAFMSPEQALGSPTIDARSDIYSLGAVAYFLTTGRLVFDHASAVGMAHAHAYEEFQPGPEFDDIVPLPLQYVIRRCLEKDPNRRYQDAASLETALADCSAGSDWSQAQAADWWRRLDQVEADGGDWIETATVERAPTA